MEANLINIAIQENDLELQIKEQKLGVLTTNAKDIKALIENVLPNYDVANYNEDNIDVAKKDKALLNKASKVLNEKRIELEKQFLAPFNEFKEIINETCKLIKTATDKIDAVVKESEQKEKDTKRQLIEEYFEILGFELVSLDRIFDDKWLNKTAKIKDIRSEISEKVNKIKDDLVTIEAIGNDVDLLKSLYLDTLNLNNTIQYANTLKANKEKAQKEAEERAKVSVPTQETVQSTGIDDSNPFEEPKESPQAINVEKPAISTESKSGLLTRTMKVVGTYDQLLALGNYMNSNEIYFEKIEL